MTRNSDHIEPNQTEVELIAALADHSSPENAELPPLEKVIAALKTGHKYLGPDEVDLAAAAWLERLRIPAQCARDRDAIAAVINDRTMINDEGFVQNSEAVADAILALTSPYDNTRAGAEPATSVQLSRSLDQVGRTGDSISPTGAIQPQIMRDADTRWAVNVLLEKIASKFEDWETLDLWRSEAASTVRSFKHDLALTRPEHRPTEIEDGQS